MVRKAHRRGFGHVRKLPSGRYQASYMGPDLHRHAAAWTFDAKIDAEAWLALENRLIALDAWTSPAQRLVPPSKALTFGEYAETWLAERPLKPRSHQRYRSILDRDLLPAFGDMTLNVISPELVRTWHARFSTSKPTARSQAYSLLRTVLGTAVMDGLLPVQPLPHPRRGQREACAQGRAGHPGGAREDHQRDAAALPAHGPARRLVRPALRRTGRAPPQGPRPVTNGVVRIRRAVVRVKASSSSAPPRPTPAPATWPSRPT